MIFKVNSQDLKRTMFRVYGPLIGGSDLRQVLGFRTASAFNRAVRINAIGVNVFNLPRRRGKFALTSEVAMWLISVSSKKGGC